MPNSSGVAEGLDLFRLGGEVLVLAIFQFALIDKGLKVGVVLDGAGRADADHLHLTGHAFFPERVHHQQRGDVDQAVRGAVLVLVELDGA